jgi:hypothetical protein
VNVRVSASVSHRLLELAPVNWTKTLELADVVALLDADPFRRASL